MSARRYNTDTRSALVFISGKDVLHGIGGHESYVRAHMLAADALGFEPHVFCVGRRPAAATAAFGTVHYVAPWLPVAAQPWRLARAVQRFLAQHRGRGPHLIHGFGIWSAAAALAARSLALEGVSTVPIASAYATRRHEIGAMARGARAYTDARHRFLYWSWARWAAAVEHPIEGWGYKRASAVLVNYESVRRLLLAAYGPELAIRRLPYAVLDCAQPIAVDAERNGDRPMILAVSRHVPRKGLDVLLHALAKLAAADVAFHARIAGTGRMLATHRRLAAALGLDGRVTLPGPIPDVQPDLRRADIFVLPSLAEASGSLAVIEALRSGTAVVASACDGLPEDLRHGHDALLVAPGDADALADALARLLSDPPLRARLGRAARQTYSERFSATRFVSELGRVYEEVAVGAQAG